MRGADHVVVGISPWHADTPGSIHSLSQHDIFGVKTQPSTLGIVPLMNYRIMLISVPSQFWT